MKFHERLVVKQRLCLAAIFMFFSRHSIGFARGCIVNKQNFAIVLVLTSWNQGLICWIFFENVQKC